MLNQTTHIGGAEKVLIRLARQLASRGHFVVLGAPGGGPLVDLATSHGIVFEELAIPNVTRKPDPLALAVNLWQYVKGKRQIREIAKKYEVQVIHVNHLRALLPLIGRIELPIVWHVHDVFRDKWPNRQLLAAIGRRIKRAVCVSKFVERNLVKLGFCAEKCYVLHNAIEPAQMTESKSSVLRRLGIPQGVRLVGSVGQIVPGKGQHTLVEAAPRIIAVHPDTWFVLVGKAFPGTGEAFEKELNRMIKDKKLADRFYFVGFQNDVLSIMSALDVLVHTSVRPDSFPTVLLEALAAGVAIVATGVGGVPEIIEDGKDGILIKPGDPHELAEAVVKLLGNPQFLQDIRQQAKRSAVKFQDVRAWVDAWEAHYEECLQ